VEYETEITVPAGTKELTPVHVILDIEKGSLYGYVDFPFGCANLVQIRVRHGSFQIAPFNRQGWLKGSGTRIIFADRYDVKEPPYHLRIEGSAPNATLNHTPVIHAEILPTHVAKPEEVLSGQLKGIKERIDSFSEKAEGFMENVKKLLPRRST